MVVDLYISVDDTIDTTFEILDSFELRVKADSGIYEAKTCLVSLLNSLGNASGVRKVSRKIDLFQDEKISVTSSIQNINDISKIFTDYTQSFTVPASQVNNSIFRHWYENSIDNAFDQRLRYDGRIEIDTNVFRSGKWQIESASIKNNMIENYKITFFGVLTSLLDKFGEDKLKDLNTINAYTTNYTPTLVIDNVRDPADLNIHYPLISSKRFWQYNTSPNTDDINSNAGAIHYDELFPAIKVARIFDAIESKYGVSFNGNFLTQDRFDKCYLWLKNKETFVANSEQLKLNFISSTLPATSFTGITANFTTDTFTIDYPNINYNGLQIADVRFETYISLSCNIANVVLKCFVYKNGSLLSSFEFLSTTSFGPLQLIIYQDQQSTISSSGDYQVFISSRTPVTFTSKTTFFGVYNDIDQSGDPIISSATIGELLGTTAQTTNTILDLTQYMPDIKVSDFFSGILKEFNLVSFSYTNNDYTLEQLESWYYAGGIKNLTEYVTTDMEANRIKPYKKISYKYQKSEGILNRLFSDAFNREYGDLAYEFSNDGADYTIQSPFENMLFTKFTGTPLQVSYALKTDLKEYIPKPVLLYKYGNLATHFHMNNGTTHVILNKYNVFGQEVIYQNNIHSLNFGVEISSLLLTQINNTLFSDYYLSYLNNLYSLKSRMINVSMRLPYITLINLKLNDRIVIRDKRYIINTFTTDLDTFESKFELIQDFRTIYPNNNFVGRVEAKAGVTTFNFIKAEGLTWTWDYRSYMSPVFYEDYFTITAEGNTTGKERTILFNSNYGDKILITQDA